MPCQCDPPFQVVGDQVYHYNQGIGSFFRECIYTPKDQAAFALGFLSLLCYLFAQFPQLRRNYQLKKVEGLSFIFLLVW